MNPVIGAYRAVTEEAAIIIIATRIIISITTKIMNTIITKGV